MNEANNNAHIYEIAQLLTRVVITRSDEEFFDTAVAIGRLIERYGLAPEEVMQARNMADAMLTTMGEPNGN